MLFVTPGPPPARSRSTRGPPMKPPALLLLAGLLAPAFAPSRQEPGQEKQQGQEEPKKKIQNPVTRFFKEQSEYLNEQVKGAWMLFEYDDPHEAPAEDAAGGFAMFQDGLLSLMITIDTYK